MYISKHVPGDYHWLLLLLRATRYCSVTLLLTYATTNTAIPLHRSATSTVRTAATYYTTGSIIPLLPVIVTFWPFCTCSYLVQVNYVVFYIINT